MPDIVHAIPVVRTTPAPVPQRASHYRTVCLSNFPCLSREHCTELSKRLRSARQADGEEPASNLKTPQTNHLAAPPGLPGPRSLTQTTSCGPAPLPRYRHLQAVTVSARHSFTLGTSLTRTSLKRFRCIQLYSLGQSTTVALAHLGQPALPPNPFPCATGQSYRTSTGSEDVCAKPLCRYLMTIHGFVVSQRMVERDLILVAIVAPWLPGSRWVAIQDQDRSHQHDSIQERSATVHFALVAASEVAIRKTQSAAMPLEVVMALENAEG